jgi:hypothetical protein
MNKFFIFIYLFSAFAFAQDPLIDPVNLQADKNKKAAIAKECPNLKAVQLATCVSKFGIAKRFPKRGTIAYSQAAYGGLTESQAKEKYDSLELLTPKARSNIYARELIAGEVFIEDLQREMAWIETNKLAGLKRYKIVK